MKKIKLGILSLILIGAFSLSAQSDLTLSQSDSNLDAILLSPPSPCDGIDWKDYCIETWENIKCSIYTENGICSFTFMIRQ
ncbi:MAG: hypothetical protein K9J25_12830 [Bacteroidales bacterium]|nr:hypothetical protein [Bacteroidales bacterium]